MIGSHYRCFRCDVTGQAPGPCWMCEKSDKIHQVLGIANLGSKGLTWEEICTDPPMAS